MKPITIVLLLLLFVVWLLLSACGEPAASVSDRPMDEVPVQQLLLNGQREYRFANSCVIVLQPDRAIVLTESEVCELFHRDIALLYASAD